eukprot:2811349-Amphidinium_carterae.1
MVVVLHMTAPDTQNMPLDSILSCTLGPSLGFPCKTCEAHRRAWRCSPRLVEGAIALMRLVVLTGKSQPRWKPSTRHELTA